MPDKTIKRIAIYGSIVSCDTTTELKNTAAAKKMNWSFVPFSVAFSVGI